jgi:hypothetical protein
MNPLLLSGLLSFAPSFLSRLFGGDPAAAYRKKVNQLVDPQNVQRLINQFYQNAISSPAYSQAQGNIALGANTASNQLAQSLAARGIGTTGTGAVLSSLTPSLVGSQQAGLRTGAYGSAQEQALNNIKQQIDALQGSMPASQTSQLFAGGLGPFAQFLAQYLSRGGYNPTPAGGYGPTQPRYPQQAPAGY